MYIPLYTINSNKVITRSRSMESLSMSCKFAVRISGSYGLILKNDGRLCHFPWTNISKSPSGTSQWWDMVGPIPINQAGPRNIDNCDPTFFSGTMAQHCIFHNMKSKKCHLKILASPNKRAQFYEPWVSVKSLSVDVHVLIYVNILYLCLLIIHIN